MAGRRRAESDLATRPYHACFRSGLFDGLNYDDVLRLLKEYKNAHGHVDGAARMLADEAIGRNVLDNVTVVVVEFVWGNGDVAVVTDELTAQDL